LSQLAITASTIDSPNSGTRISTAIFFCLSKNVKVD
jgi:hypothetical protein